MNRPVNALRAIAIFTALVACSAHATNSHYYKSAKDEPRPDLAWVVVAVIGAEGVAADSIGVEVLPHKKPERATGFLLDRIDAVSDYVVSGRTYFAGAIPAGRYRIGTFSDGAQKTHIWFKRGSMAEFDAVAGHRTELLDLHIADIKGAGRLAYRADIPAPDAESLAHDAPALVNDGTAGWPRNSWREPIGEDERAIVRAEAARIGWVDERSATLATDGVLWVVADSGRVLARSPDGAWRSIQAPRPTVIREVSPLPDGTAIARDERGRSWRVRTSGFESLHMPGFGEHERVLRCEKQGCLAWRPNGEDEIVLSALAAGAEEWREVARARADISDIFSGRMSIAVLGDRWYVELGGKDLWVIDVVTGAVQRKDYEYNKRRLTVQGGKLIAWIGGHKEVYTVDDGATWNKLDYSIDPEQATAGFHENGVGFIRSNLYAGAIQTFVDAEQSMQLVGTADGGLTWNVTGSRPIGRLVVGRTPGALYVFAPATLAGHIVVHVSNDDGKNWQMEDLTYLTSRGRSAP